MTREFESVPTLYPDRDPRVDVNHQTWSEAQTETTVAVDGHDLSLSYRDTGSGKPVLFLHGIPTWSFLWQQITPG